MMSDFGFTSWGNDLFHPNLQAFSFLMSYPMRLNFWLRQPRDSSINLRILLSNEYMPMLITKKWLLNLIAWRQPLIFLDCWARSTTTLRCNSYSSTIASHSFRAYGCNHILLLLVSYSVLNTCISVIKSITSWHQTCITFLLNGQFLWLLLL